MKGGEEEQEREDARRKEKGQLDLLMVGIVASHNQWTEGYADMCTFALLQHTMINGKDIIYLVKTNNPQPPD